MKVTRIGPPIVALLLTTAVAASAATSPAASPKRWHKSYTYGWFQPPSEGSVIQAGRFTSVAAISPRSVLAAGFRYHNGDKYGVPRPIIEQWNGRRWRAWDRSAMPAAVRHESITGIAARSMSDVWITTVRYVGYSRPRIAHWDGVAWTTVTTEGLPPTWTGSLILRGGLTSIVGSGNAPEVDNRGFIATYQPSATHPRWTLIRAARAGYFNDGFARTAHDAWAVGLEAAGSYSRRAYVERWNGSAWHQVKVQSPLELTNVAAANKSSAMALGGKRASVIGARRALLWNGKRWRDVGHPKGTPSLDAVTADPDGGYWVAGKGLGQGYRTIYYRYAHGHWSTVRGPKRKFPHTPRQDVSVTDLATAGHSVWSVGFHRGWDSDCRESCFDKIAGAPIVDRR